MRPADVQTQAGRVLRLLVLAAVLAHPLVYLGFFAGDAEIHMVYARNAAQGHFFEFNAGEKSAGETSPGYMLCLAGLYRLLPEKAIPLAVQGLCMVAWYALAWLSFALAKEMLGSGGVATACAAVVGLLPGSAFNAVIGMENIYFGALVVGWLLLASRMHWFDGRRPRGLRGWAPDLLLIPACWLRPEGFIVAAIAYALVGTTRLRSAGPVRAVVETGVQALPAAVGACAVFLFEHFETGHWLPTSGLGRIIMGSLGAVRIGPLHVNFRVVERLAAYAPVTALYALSLVALARSARPRRAPSMFAALVPLVFFVLFSTVLGAAHLARYLIFVMPLFVISAGSGLLLLLRWAAARPSRRWIAWAPLGLAGAWMTCLLFFETRIRLTLTGHDGLLGVVHAIENRKADSDAMLERLGDPKERPVVLAYTEVQIRNRLDERFVVRSLDGRVDADMLQYVHDGYFDHVGYLKDRHVDFVMEQPDYNTDPSRWSLRDLEALRPGERLEREGVVFTALGHPGDGYRVDTPVAGGVAPRCAPRASTRYLTGPRQPPRPAPPPAGGLVSP